MLLDDISKSMQSSRNIAKSRDGCGLGLHMHGPLTDVMQTESLLCKYQDSHTDA